MPEAIGPRPTIPATDAMELVVYDPATPDQPQKVDPKDASFGQLLAQALTALGYVAPEDPAFAEALIDANGAIATIRGVAPPTTAVDFAAQLQALADAVEAFDAFKAEMKAEIEAKGVSVGTAPLDSYPSLVRTISGTGGGGGAEENSALGFYDNEPLLGFYDNEPLTVGT